MFDWLIDANFDKADNGQKLQSPILKMSTKSPCGFLIAFGNRMLMIAEPESEKWTRSQVRFSCGLFFSSGRISPNQKEPKKATQQAAHTTVLLSFVHSLFAILWPKIFKSEKVITNFAGLKMLE